MIYPSQKQRYMFYALLQARGMLIGLTAADVVEIGLLPLGLTYGETTRRLSLEIARLATAQTSLPQLLACDLAQTYRVDATLDKMPCVCVAVKSRIRLAPVPAVAPVGFRRSGLCRRSNGRRPPCQWPHWFENRGTTRPK